MGMQDRDWYKEDFYRRMGKPGSPTDPQKKKPLHSDHDKKVMMNVSSYNVRKAAKGALSAREQRKKRIELALITMAGLAVLAILFLHF